MKFHRSIYDSARTRGSALLFDIASLRETLSLLTEEKEVKGMLLKTRSCARCRGDMAVDKDQDGFWYGWCLQCGYRLYLADIKKRPSNANNSRVSDF